VVITKTGNLASINKSKIPGITLKENHMPVKRFSNLSRMGTSKLHKFHPSVNLIQATNWLNEFSAVDASIMFDNNCAVLFEQGKFLEFEDIRDEEEEEMNNQSINQSTIDTKSSLHFIEQKNDIEEGDSNEVVYVAPPAETVESFKLGSQAE